MRSLATYRSDLSAERTRASECNRLPSHICMQPSGTNTPWQELVFSLYFLLVFRGRSDFRTPPDFNVTFESPSDSSISSISSISFVSIANFSITYYTLFFLRCCSISNSGLRSRLKSTVTIHAAVLYFFTQCKMYIFVYFSYLQFGKMEFSRRKKYQILSHSNCQLPQLDSQFLYYPSNFGQSSWTCRNSFAPAIQ